MSTKTQVSAPASANGAQASQYEVQANRFVQTYRHAFDAIRTDPQLKGSKLASVLKPLYRSYLDAEEAYAKEARSLKGRAGFVELQNAHDQIIELALELFPRAEDVRASGQVQSLSNKGGNCSFNALLQMLFSSPTLIEALIQVPELTELRKIYLQYTGILKGPIDTQALREELHELNPEISLNVAHWEDAHEVLATMLRYIPGEVAEGIFPRTQLLRTYHPNPTAQDNDVAHASQFIQDAQGTYTLKTEDPDPFLSLHPTPGADGTASFDDVLGNALNTDARGDNPVGFLHAGDNAHRHFHQPLRSMRSYATTPDQLILNTARFRGGRDDTPMQMPRVLTLPEGSVRDDSDRRLLLRSFVVYKPGHYVTYVRKGQYWYYCSDSTTRRVTLADVDKALCYTKGGGSYLHYYERASAEAFNAEPAMTNNVIESARQEREREKLKKQPAKPASTKTEPSNNSAAAKQKKRLCSV